MKLIVDVSNAKVVDGKLVIDCDVKKEFGFTIKSNDGSREDDGWLRITKNNTLNVIRIK